MESTSDVTTPVTPPVPVTPEPAPAPEPAKVQDAPSIDAHAQDFDPALPKETADEKTARQLAAELRARDDAGKFARPERHRAKSQRATAEDVGRIGELTKKWRTEETQRKELADKYAALEKEIQALKAPKVEPPQPPQTFGDREPVLDDFAQSDDPYRDYVRAMATYDRKRDAAAEAQSRHEAERSRYESQVNSQANAEFSRVVDGFASRQDAFKAKTPDYEKVLRAADSARLPDVVQMAILADDRGPEFAYTLARRPELLAEVLLLGDGKPVTEQSVALMRRVLGARVPVAVTGSTATPSRTYVPPQPPNPVRTGPIKPSDDPPAEASSVAEHARYFGPKR